MLIGEKKIERPLRWGMIGGGRTANVDRSIVAARCMTIRCSNSSAVPSTLILPAMLSSALILVSKKIVSIPITKQ